MPLRVRVITTISEMQDLSADWYRLLDRTGTFSVFSTPGFCSAWWKAFNAKRSLRLVVVDDGQAVRLIAPLFHEDSNPGLLKAIGFQYADYSDVLVAPTDTDAVNYFLAWLFRESSWSKLMIRGLPKDSALLRQYGSSPAITSPLKQRLLSSLDIRRPPVFADVADGHFCADYKDIQECKNIMQKEHYRRNNNWFKQRGKVEYQVLTEKTACLEALPTFFEMHLAQWSKKQDSQPNSEPSMSFADAESREFFHHLVDELCPQSGMRLDVLSLDGTPIAMHCGLTFKGKMSSYKQCFAESLSRSPGKLLLGYILKQAADNDIQEIDGLGSYAHMASRRNPVGSLIIYRTNRDAIVDELKAVPHKLRSRRLSA